MSVYQRQIAAVIQSVTFHSPTRFAWIGEHSPALSPADKQTLTPETARAYLRYMLRQRLYSSFYCSGGAMPAPHESIPRPSGQGMTSFVAGLSAANNGQGCWEAAQIVRVCADNAVIVKQGEVELLAHPHEYIALEPDQLIPGAAIHLRLPKELLGISPGFYMALGDKSLTDDPGHDIVRLYWHVAPHGAAHFMRQMTTALNSAGLPFRLKVVSDPDSFTRCDAAVLYIARCDYQAVAEVLEREYATVAAWLQPAVPALTKFLAPGLGLAENPAADDSFGSHRCGLLAEGLIRAREQRSRNARKRLNVVTDCFTEAGISLDAPYLNPGSVDIYAFQPQPGRRPRGSSRRSGVKPPGNYLHVATEIGQRLAREAIWHEERCNWMGADAGGTGTRVAPSGTVLRALGPDIYAGSSGIAWFLADLHALTQVAATRRTALGAARHALARAEDLPPARAIGLFTGQLGIALTAARVGTMLGAHDLLEGAARLVRHALDNDWDERTSDVCGGAAGAILALLALRALLEERALVEHATQFGDWLVRTARRSDDGCSWQGAGSSRRRNLTGFLHGAAGIGYALIELFRATHAAVYREAAEQAFAYERHWFDSAAGNWPDFRTESGRQRVAGHPRTFATAWCHGAPGIALSRIHAWKVLGDERYKAEALIALRTTRLSITAALAAKTGNFSLCHGLAGNADILLTGERESGSETPGGLQTAQAVAGAGIEEYARSGVAWPCGTGDGETPSLMLGLAGIGYFYLRLHAPTTPSVLMAQPGCHECC